MEMLIQAENKILQLCCLLSRGGVTWFTIIVPFTGNSEIDIRSESFELTPSS